MKNNKTNKFVFLIVSPFQYICALEYIDLNKIEKKKCELILLSHLPLTITQIEKIGFLDFFNTVNKPMLYSKNVWINLFKTKSLIKSFKSSNFILGNILSIWCKYALDISSFPEKAVLLDDGTSTLNVVRNRNSNNFMLEIPQSKSKIGFFTKYFLKPKVEWNQSLLFFSIFKFKKNSLDSYILNNLHFTKNNFKCENQKVVNEIWFIGAPLVERGYISSEHQNQILEELLIFCKKQNCELKYFSHRVEKLEILKGVEVRKNELPFEIYFLKSKEIPKFIFSFVSTSIYTTSLFETSTQFVSIYINDEMRTNKNLKVWENIEHMYSVFEDTPNINFVKNINQL